MKNLAKLHPNAASAGAATGTAAGVVSVLAAVGITCPPILAVWLVAAAPVVFLALKRRGVKGLVLEFWRGDEEVGS